MKRYLQTVTSILLALVLFLEPCLTAHAVETGGVQERLDQILNDYPDGSFFTVNGEACNHTPYGYCDNCKLGNVCKKTEKLSRLNNQGPYGRAKVLQLM